jgi:hypothetical protein
MTNKLGYALAVGGVYILLEWLGGAAAELPSLALIGLGLVAPAMMFLCAAWILAMPSHRISQLRKAE